MNSGQFKDPISAGAVVTRGGRFKPFNVMANISGHQKQRIQ